MASTFSAAWAEGKTMMMKQAVGDALEKSDI
jgi:hypothetical protein